jgi:hypothetical protein
MSLQGRGTMTAPTDGLAAYQDQSRTKPAFGAARLMALRAKLADPWPLTMIGLRAKLADLWPLTMIALALGLTLAWTGLLMSLLWRGIARLI